MERKESGHIPRDHKTWDSAVRSLHGSSPTCTLACTQEVLCSMALWNVCRGIRIRSSFWLSQGLSYGERTKGLGFLWKSYAPWPSLSQRLHLRDILCVGWAFWHRSLQRPWTFRPQQGRCAVEQVSTTLWKYSELLKRKRRRSLHTGFLLWQWTVSSGENVFLWSELWLLIEDCWVHRVWNRTWLPLHTKTLSQNFLSALPAKWQFFSIFLGHLGHYYSKLNPLPPTRKKFLS